RQAAGVALGDGRVGEALRRQLLVGAGAAGARRRGRGRAAVRGGATRQWRHRRTARRRRARDHSGGGADLPVQQPRRAAHAAADRCGVRDGPRHRRSATAVAGAGRRADRLRISDEDAPGAVRGPGIRDRLPGRCTGGGFSSTQTGLFRLFDAEMGTQIAWLLPAALIATAALGWLTARRPRTDPLRTSAIVWGGWLLVTALILSLASGIIHPYYTV